MGVLNITPDSFSDGGQLLADTTPDAELILAAAQAMLSEGAAVLDIGGESTRPGAQPVSIAEELERVIPVVELLSELDTILSVDTRHAEVAQAAIAAGAHIINDVSAGADKDMLEVISGSSVGYALMHMQGTPQMMQDNPRYTNVVNEVRGYLATRVEACLQQGIALERLIVDPGFGFGKTQQHNLQLLSHLPDLRVADLPLLVGLSRKSMLGHITGRDVGQRSYASVGAALLAIQRGADLVRVHDVGPTQDVIKLFTALEQTEKLQ